MIEKINIEQMKRDALNAGNYEKFIEDTILNKINELVDEVNGSS